jgi:hypothetical protein
MANLKPVSRQSHGGQMWRRLATYSFTAKDSYVPIVGSELGRVVTTLPVAFMESGGQFMPVAVLSFTPGQNLFVAPNGKWLGLYVPMLYQTYPFRLLRMPETDQYALFVDDDAQALPDAAVSTELFYDTEGNLSPATKAVFDALVQFEQQRLATQVAVAALAAERLICPWPIKLQDGDTERTVGGLHRIDETALVAMSDEAFLRLRKAGALVIAYSQLLSLGQLGHFSHLQELHNRVGQPVPVPPPPSAASPRQPGFVMIDPETLRFD